MTVTIAAQGSLTCCADGVTAPIAHIGDGHQIRLPVLALPYLWSDCGFAGIMRNIPGQQ